MGKNKNRVHYYEDFPSYGKPRKICEHCIKDYLKTSYIRINANIPINKYLIPKKNHATHKGLYYKPPYKK